MGRAGRELDAGECFLSSERRLNERQEMWVRVDGGDGQVRGSDPRTLAP